MDRRPVDDIWHLLVTPTFMEWFSPILGSFVVILGTLWIVQF